MGLVHGERWHGAVLAYAYGRAWLALAAATLGTGVLGALALGSGGTQRILLVGVSVIALLLVRRIVVGDRYDGRSYLLFQRAVTPRSHYTRTLVLAVGALVVAIIIVAVVIAAAALVTGNGQRQVWGGAAGALLWGVTLLATGFGLSAVVRHYDVELLTGFVFVSLGQAYLMPLLGVSAGAANVLAWLLVPIDGIFLLWEYLTVGTARLDAVLLFHIAVYPAVWVAAGLWRSERLDLLPP